MNYRKFQADQVFTGTEMMGSGFVLITDGKGTVADLVPASQAGEDIQQLGGILLPGLINCHCHLELSHMKGLIPEKTGLVDFVFRVVTERHFSEEAILDAIRLAEDDMIDAGIVAVGDICNNMHTLAQKQQARMAYYNFTEVSGWLPEAAEARFERAQETAAAFEHGLLPGNRTSLSPHAPYSVSEQLWQLMQPGFAGKTITIHNQETPFEDELFTSGQGDFSRMYQMMKLDTSFFTPPGKTSLQCYLHKLQTAGQVLLVHNTFTGEADIAWAASVPVAANWCLCVNANQYIEQSLPPVQLLRRYGARIVIGTDSLASNHSLSVLDELKTIHRHFPGIPVEELLGWATYNGALALQLQSAYGSFEKGKTPGINLLQGLADNRIGNSTTIQKLL
ncbi:amidohydrolase family protein [Sediminibacterium soli]|uniref:amidohydrolase family protein n=1 Tax=Sediminibacterium soli TaxID=2698829 RepID=UPI00137AF6E3|nr:amidohydrolase family protein [Sediminibacterium soli]NCI45148.1 amidohydrolase family protein [Sediminibacterium soli]